MDELKLNLGCGRDRMPGFVNIDGDPNVLPDRVMVFPEDRLISFFPCGGVDVVVAYDFIEHFHHWEACGILKDCRDVLKTGGRLALKTPCLERLLKSGMPLDRKARWLYGGQDIPDGGAGDSLRSKHPRFFCHHYLWTRKALCDHLSDLGFVNTGFSWAGVNMLMTAIKK